MQHHMVETDIGRKVMLRLVLPSALFILVGAIDRANVGFAALQMNAALGLSSAQYGFGAGVLFIGYLAAKYPSVLLYEAIGMRRWLGTITVAWGICASAMALVQNEWQLYGLRIVIGFAEGGLSSGLMIYLSHWASERYRASVLAIPIMAISIAQVIGAPLSGWLIDSPNPLGWEGWRWMFLVEGLPAVVLGVFAWFYYPDGPAQARWLAPAQRAWLIENVKGAAKPARGAAAPGRWGALRSPVGWLCALIWFCILSGNYGVMFWLPQIVRGISGLTPSEVGLIVALPWAGSAIGLFFNARHSDRTQERFLHIAVPALVGGTGLILAYLLGPGLPGLLMLILGGACVGCTVAAFWAIPTKLLPPESLAMGIVMINIIGSLAGATVPTLMGLLRDISGSFLPPTLLLFGIQAVCALLCLVARHLERRGLARAPAIA
ncbi:MFS transporter [Sphingosinithalassobacter sp. CS137]|uniref:MFS transporter n=1 Tax=Sphingosinithalassobacter sp. CS137 TaxID=2762748 RepID=UPI0021CEE0D2|nr:MFS transporter [Sphingosinithalassobacter sp. CS137]